MWNRTKKRLVENNKFLEKTNHEDVKDIVNQQVNLLGSAQLYQRIDKNFREHKFEKFFAKEQFKLFNWRKTNFYTKFGHYDQRNSSGIRTWYTDGSDDSHSMDTVPYQITKKFDNVMALACSAENNSNADTSIYFECDENLSSDANFKFNSEYTEYFVEDDMLEETGMSFADVAHMIVAIHRIGPSSLLEAAIKTVLLHHLPMQDIPKSLQKKATEGLYRLDDPSPINMSSAGLELFQNFRQYLIEESLEQ